ncbi:MAG: PGPGW domain-containing protein [Eubacteriales bacterium]
MSRGLKRIAILCLGWFFIILGIVGLFLPLLQGILFILLGLYVLSQESLWAKNLLNFTRRRFPSLHYKLEQAKAKPKKLFRRLFGK